jgi:hypothetical protein
LGSPQPDHDYAVCFSFFQALRNTTEDGGKGCMLIRESYSRASARPLFESGAIILGSNPGAA